MAGFEVITEADARAVVGLGKHLVV